MAIDWATWGPIIAGAAGTGLTTYMNNRNANKNRELQQSEDAAGRLFSEKQALRNTALQESTLDPFRQQMSQAKDLTALDAIARARNTPVSIGATGKYAKYVPTVSGGFSYDMSPDMREAAKRIQRSVAAGETAPTMTDPNNYGKTSVLNLVSPGASTGYAGNGQTTPSSGAGAVPRGASTPSAANTDLGSSVFGVGAEPGSPSYSTNQEDLAMDAMSPYASYYANYRRRREGAGGAGAGALKGLGYGSVAGPIGAGVGAAAGAIAGAFTKNAESAYSDFYVDDAKQIVKQAWQSILGRQPSDEDVMQGFANLGWKPGDRWVGQEGLDYIIRKLQQSPEAQQRRQQMAQQTTLTPSYTGLFAA